MSDSIHEPRNASNDCARCGHEFSEHERYGRCNGYHCHCRGFMAKVGARIGAQATFTVTYR